MTDELKEWLLKARSKEGLGEKEKEEIGENADKGKEGR